MDCLLQHEVGYLRRRRQIATATERQTAWPNQTRHDAKTTPDHGKQRNRKGHAL